MPKEWVMIMAEQNLNDIGFRYHKELAANIRTMKVLAVERVRRPTTLWDRILRWSRKSP